MSQVRPYPEGNGPGTWRRWKDRVLFTCPLCSKTYELDHTVLVDGTLDASVVCASEPCSFHEWIRLEGWNPS